MKLPSMSIKPLTNILIIITIQLSAFHLMVLTGFVPYQYVGGGRIQSYSEMVGMEITALIVNIFFILLLLMKSKRIRPFSGMKVVNGILWAFFGLFCLNTIGNLLAPTLLERSFAFVTSAMSILLLILLLKKK